LLIFIIEHWSKQKNYLIHANFLQKLIIVDSSYLKLFKRESDSFNDKVIWAYQKLDEESKNILEKLYHRAKNLKPSK